MSGAPTVGTDPISSAQPQGSSFTGNSMNSINADVVRKSIDIHHATIYGAHNLSFPAVKYFQTPMIL